MDSKKNFLISAVILLVVGVAVALLRPDNDVGVYLDEQLPHSTEQTSVPSEGDAKRAERSDAMPAAAGIRQSSPAGDIPPGLNTGDSSNPPEGLPEDLKAALDGPPPELPDDLRQQLEAAPPELPDDLRKQLNSPPPELPDDLKAQLEGPPPEIPEDIKRALNTPPREVSIEEVNTPPEQR